MSLYEQNKEFYNTPVLLTKEQREEPLTVIEGFFSYAHLYQAREILADILHVALTTDNSEFNDGGKRLSLIHFCNQVEQLIEAAFILHSQQPKKV